MAWYRIAENVLDAIANAINAKTGKTAPMTPVDMVSEIESIQTGGGGGMSWELVADYTSDEDAAVVIATIPEGKQNANIYKLEFSNSNSSGIGYYPRMLVNSETSPYGGDAQSPRTATGYISRRLPASYSGEGNSVAFGVGDITKIASYPITRIGLSSYSSEHAIKAGTRIRVWRLVES